MQQPRHRTRSLPRWLIPAAGIGTGAFLAGPALLTVLGQLMAPVRDEVTDWSVLPLALILFSGGLVLAGAGIAYLRRHAPPCPRCGGGEAGGTRPVAYLIAYVAAALSLAYGLSHFWWGLGVPFGFPSQGHANSGEALAAAQKTGGTGLLLGEWMMGSFGPVAAVIALATVHQWGRRVPRWLLSVPSWLGFGMLTITFRTTAYFQLNIDEFFFAPNVVLAVAWFGVAMSFSYRTTLRCGHSNQFSVVARDVEELS